MGKTSQAQLEASRRWRGRMIAEQRCVVCGTQDANTLERGLRRCQFCARKNALCKARQRERETKNAAAAATTDGRKESV